MKKKDLTPLILKIRLLSALHSVLSHSMWDRQGSCYALAIYDVIKPSTP